MLTFCLAILVATPSAEPTSFVLASPSIRLTVYPPDPVNGFTRSTRFDWSGIVGKVEFDGHRFFDYWKNTRDPDNHDDVPGTAEEFSQPIGYDIAKQGEAFMKVGVGLLEKPDDKPYRFATRYKFVRQGTWTTKHTPTSAEFTQELAHPAGYGYRYVKTIELDTERAGFIIRRTLSNTGTRPLETNHYGHHFTRIDGDPIDPEYAVQFGFDPKFREGAKLNGLAELRGAELRFLKPLEKSFVYGELEGFGKDPAENRFVIINLRSGYAVKATGDRPLSKFHFWAVSTACCPEPYVDVKVAPGESMTWSTKYQFMPPR